MRLHVSRGVIPLISNPLKGEGIWRQNSFLSAAGAEIFVRHQQQLRAFRRFKPRHSLPSMNDADGAVYVRLPVIQDQV